MTEQNTPSEASRQAYIEFLYTKAIEGDVEAGGELSMIALGGYQPARELVKKMDQLLAGGTFEGTPDLPLPRPFEKGGVQLEDWPKADQERMLRGELPRGVPLHRNV